jgi:hypothetical protein
MQVRVDVFVHCILILFPSSFFFSFVCSDRGTSSRSDYRVTVENLPRDMSWQDLKDRFRQVGDVVFADVFPDRSGRVRVSSLSPTLSLLLSVTLSLPDLSPGFSLLSLSPSPFTLHLNSFLPHTFPHRFLFLCLQGYVATFRLLSSHFSSPPLSSLP